MTDQELEDILSQIRTYRLAHQGDLSPDQIEFVKENSLLIDDYYRRRYMAFFDLCPYKVRRHVNNGIVIEDPESVTGRRNVAPTLRQAFTQLGVDLGEWCLENGVELTDDTLDLI